MVLTHLVLFNFFNGGSPGGAVAVSPPLLMLLGVGN